MNDITSQNMDIYPMDYMYLIKDGEGFTKEYGNTHNNAERLMTYMAKVQDIDVRLLEFFKREYDVDMEKYIPGAALYQSVGLYRIFSSIHPSPFSGHFSNNDIIGDKFFIYIQNGFVNKYTLLRTGKCVDIASRDDIINALIDNAVDYTVIDDIMMVLPSIE